MATSNVASSKAWYALAVARLMLAFVFLWAFFDKLIGLKMATQPAKAWLAGGSPTTGFLKGVDGPFAGFFNGMSGTVWADWLFMLGLLGLGIALLLGWGLRIAAVTGSLLLVLMWLASLPLSNNPFVDDHLVYAAVLWVVALGEQRLSLAGFWRSLPFVRANPWLK